VSDRRRHLTLLAVILAALAGVALLAIPGSPTHRKPTLGLDLEGGLEVVLQAVPPKGQPVTPEGMSQALSIMRSRVDKLGVSEPVITKQAKDQMVIELAGVHNAATAASIIGKTAQLQLFDLETSLAGPSGGLDGATPTPSASLYDLLTRVQSRVKPGTAAAFYLFGPHHRLVVGPAFSRSELLDLAGKKHVPAGYKVLGVPQHEEIVFCSSTDRLCPGPQGGVVPQTTVYYLFKDNPKVSTVPGVTGVPQLTGSDLHNSGIRADIDPNRGPIVVMSFSHKGQKKFQKVTQDEYQRGRLKNNTPQHFAIVLDGEIKSFPQIDPTDSGLSNGISNGGQIEGIGSIGEAKQLATVLQTGSLPYTFRTLERTDISATLGKDSLAQAKRAALVGLLVVALFLLLLYRFLGLVAVIGLGIYAAFLYAAILLFHVTLTLPGFAGLILTIGVAADANVVVFERIKEEVRAGKSVRAAIAAGYSKGFHTILDANVVTAITALVLFAVATAQVKGFALMLLIGTVISLITAVAATRAMLGLLAGFSWFSNPRFMGAHGQQTGKWLQIDFMRRRYWWFALSGLVVVLGAGALGIRGLNLGIDFKGGTQLTFKTPAAHSTGDIRQVMNTQGYGDAVIQGRGATTNGGYKSFQVRTKALSGDKLTKVTRALANELQTKAPGATTVSSSFGRQIARSAVIAVIVSLFLVVLYIAIRFDLKFAVPVIAAMLHDVLICIGIYALVGREVTSSTVAAILTVLGYSIYDTIIIFDRIRENIPLMRRSSFATIANVSLWETIRRSLATSFITLLPVGALFLFGGATLKDFAFALIVGIASGAYSSIFIAAPLLTIWKEREPEYARRKDVTITKAGLEAEFERAEEAAAEAPAPELAPVATVDGGSDGSGAAAAAEKRERRRQRRRSRPHGRAR
jgi:SecD/SecF fusion protein